MEEFFCLSQLDQVQLQFASELLSSQSLCGSDFPLTAKNKVSDLQEKTKKLLQNMVAWHKCMSDVTIKPRNNRNEA